MQAYKSTEGQPSLGDTNSAIIRLDNFEGPFDLLLYLVKNAKINIFDLSLSGITGQFIDVIGQNDLESTADFIFTAAELLYLKSRTLIPIETEIEDESEDDREEYIENLIEYQKYKNVTMLIKKNMDSGRILMRRDPQYVMDFDDVENWVEVSVMDLIMAFSRVVQEVDTPLLKIGIEEITIEDKIDDILNHLIDEQDVMFKSLFPAACSRYELIITFLALLELVKMKKIFILQHRLFGNIKLVRRERA